MSVRLLKKVLKEQDQLQQTGQNDQDEVSESGSLDAVVRSKINPFDLLNDDDEDDKEAQDNETEVCGETLSGKEEKERSIHLQENAGFGQKAKRKKKKKSKERESSTREKTEQSLDKTLESLSLDGNSSSQQRQTVDAESEKSKIQDDPVNKNTLPSLLQVDSKYLNAENELRRIFGAKVVRSFEKTNQSSTSRQSRGARRGTQHFRRTLLVSPSDHWPRWDGSFSMELLETKNGYHHFRYAFSSSYNQAQRAFEAAQAIHDLNGVATILLNHPYHVDSLITMADYFKFVGEHQMASDAIGKCLYALECAWHPMFTPLQGNCQLKFQHETNKPLFTALFSHMSTMHKRGCHRSALEVCKLLLSLDTDDPVGALFCIDYFALRAREYKWLERFSEEHKSDNSLWLFPNFCYSLAICRLYLEQEESSEETGKENLKASSVDLMKQALLLHPQVLKKMVAKVPLKDKAFTTIVGNSYFRSDQTKIPSLDHLISIYVERSYLMWRLPDVQKLLRDAAELAVKHLDENENEERDWACVRREAFPSEKNEYSHLMVQDFSDSVPTLPPDNVQNFMVDARMVELRHMRDGAMNQQGGAQVPPPQDVTNRNPLAVLFESMLPWVHYGEEDGAGAEVQHDDRWDQNAED